MDELQQKIIEDTVGNSELLAEFNKFINKIVEEAKQHIYFDAKFFTKCGRVEDEILDAYSELTRIDNLDYWLKMAVLDRLSDRLESLRGHNTTE